MERNIERIQFNVNNILRYSYNNSKIQIFEVPIIDIPFQEVFSSGGGKEGTLEPPDVTPGGNTCPELYPNDFASCFQCAVEECSNDALCVIACGFYPASCVLGFTLACS